MHTDDSGTNPAAAVVEDTTAMAVVERQKLQRSLRRVDMLFFTLCALIGLDTLGQVSSYGAVTFSWLVILAVLFVLPYALVMAEVGSAFTQEGGPYEWMKLALGRFLAGIGAVLYWITTPVWVGGSLAFIATDAWSAHIHAIGSGWTIGNVVFKLSFIWITIAVAIVALRYGKWIPNAGAVVRVGVLALFSVTVLIYAIEHGVHGYGAGGFNPFKLAAFLGLAPLLLFNYVGFELQNGAAEEMRHPRRDVPVTVLRSAVLTALAYGIPVFGIVAVLPTQKISGISGFLDAIGQTFTVYGSAGHLLTQVMTLGFIFAVLTSGSVWIIGSDRILAVAAYDGAFPAYFGRFHSTLGTPVRVNVMSGVIGTAFCGFAVWLLAGSQANTFLVVLYLATSATLLGYLLIFPTVPLLRRKFPDVPRPYRVPGGMAGLVAATALCMFWMLLGSWVAIFPGSLDHLFGGSFSVPDVYGVSWARFEAFTLGTLAVMLLIGVVGYLLAAPARRSQVTLPIEEGGRQQAANTARPQGERL
jgi:glutamate:GABA antiporter